MSIFMEKVGSFIFLVILSISFYCGVVYLFPKVGISGQRYVYYTYGVVFKNDTNMFNILNQKMEKGEDFKQKTLDNRKREYALYKKKLKHDALNIFIKSLSIILCYLFLRFGYRRSS